MRKLALALKYGQPLEASSREGMAFGGIGLEI